MWKLKISTKAVCPVCIDPKIIAYLVGNMRLILVQAGSIHHFQSNKVQVYKGNVAPWECTADHPQLQVTPRITIVSMQQG